MREPEPAHPLLAVLAVWLAVGIFLPVALGGLAINSWPLFLGAGVAFFALTGWATR